MKILLKCKQICLVGDSDKPKFGLGLGWTEDKHVYVHVRIPSYSPKHLAITPRIPQRHRRLQVQATC